jgi:general nucleoside transport system permease protein
VTRLLRRAGAPLAAPTAALAVSLLIGAAIMAVSGVDPAAGYESMLRGAFGSSAAIGRTLQTATPLILTGIAVSLAFRGGLFNIGGDGQFAAGAVTAAWAGVSLHLPGPLGPVAVLLLGGLGGALVGALAGVLKARFGAHEVVVTIMLNFIVANLATWLLLHTLSGHTQVPGSAMIDDGNRLAPVSDSTGGLHWGFVVAVLGAVAAWLLLWRTARGYELRVAGLAPAAARYAGVSPVAAAVLAIGGGGAFAGLAGAGEVLGTYGHMTVPFVSGLGFLGIGVALLGRNHPLGCIPAGIALGALSAGGQQMQFDVGISPSLINVLVGVLLLFVTVNVLRTRRRHAVDPEPATTGAAAAEVSRA